MSNPMNSSIGTVTEFKELIKSNYISMRSRAFLQYAISQPEQFVYAMRHRFIGWLTMNDITAFCFVLATFIAARKIDPNAQALKDVDLTKLAKLLAALVCGDKAKIRTCLADEDNPLKKLFMALLIDGVYGDNPLNLNKAIKVYNSFASKLMRISTWIVSRDLLSVIGKVFKQSVYDAVNGAVEQKVKRGKPTVTDDKFGSINVDDSDDSGDESSSDDDESGKPGSTTGGGEVEHDPYNQKPSSTGGKGEDDVKGEVIIEGGSEEEKEFEPEPQPGPEPEPESESESEEETEEETEPETEPEPEPEPEPKKDGHVFNYEKLKGGQITNGKLVIPKECTEIDIDMGDGKVVGWGNNSFSETLENVKAVKYISIHNRVQNIKQFKGFIYVEQITFEDGGDTEAKICERAFFNTGNELTELSIPGRYKFIGDSAFTNLKKLTTLTIKEGVAHIGGSAFSGCGIEKLVIPNSVKELGSNVFQNCKQLEELVIGEGVETMGNACFIGDKALKKITILSESINEVGWGLFKDCNSIEELIVPEQLEDPAIKQIVKIPPLPSLKRDKEGSRHGFKIKSKSRDVAEKILKKAGVAESDFGHYIEVLQ